MRLQAPLSVRYEYDAFTLEPDSPTLAFARDQLDAYLARIFTGGDPDRQQQLTVRFTNLSAAELCFDGYAIEVNASAVTIASTLERGFLYGVYELLRIIGCRFLFPDAELEQIPHLTEFQLEERTIVKKPWMEYRGMCLYDTSRNTFERTRDTIDWMAKNNYNLLLTSIDRPDDSVDGAHSILWNEIANELLPELRKRGIAIDMSEHSTDYFFPRDHWFELHPEWFSLFDGKREPLKLCYSNEDAVREYANSFVQFVQQDDYYQFIGTWPLDGGGYCQCEGCRDSQAILRANAYIADEIAKVRPDLIVEHLAYTPQSFDRPQGDLPRNMSVLVCNVNDQVAYEWGMKAKHAGGAFYFDYHTGDHYCFRSNLWINPDYIREMVNTFAAYDYRGIVSLYLPITSWWVASLNYAYLSRLYYEPTASIEELTSELSADLFGSRNRDLTTAILMLVQGQLQDSTLWSGTPHKHVYYCEHITGRNRELDRLHAERFASTMSDIESKFNRIDLTDASPFEHMQLECLREYVRLQDLYFRCVDQYDADVDSPTKAEPYFQALRDAESRLVQAFITERYARWRIVGRDNIFVPNNVNQYQPQT
ncbi:DUF4838 domain-containing protein [Paenibacillus pasadenensis]|uniref:DUF4838 domain-containing protein n=1 Tax=Paenibacillus pasadenensis TaxID=217090 RepID=UPI002040F48D|nr:DUF4838 domain-containing protein [Paenibacillus pasadenensis]MCM3749032.1 DUF4838 domain-containing protein [Paenibacillus pasadenensis]